MKEFIEIPATNISLMARKPIHGVGINDSNYNVTGIVSGKKISCPYYQAWLNMITRSYSKKYQEKHTTYNGCSVCYEWLAFSIFRLWMIKQDWKGKQLDKDLLKLGNKVYSPSTCLFVSRQINTLLTDSGKIRGEFPLGVHLNKSNGRYRAKCMTYGKQNRIGYFKTVNEAEYAYLIFKSNHVRDVALAQIEPLKSILMSRSALLESKALLIGLATD